MRLEHWQQTWRKLRQTRWMRVIFLTIHQAEKQDLFTHVAALTYSTVLSVVPLLALVLALGRGFGMNEYIERQLRSNLNTSDDVIGQLMKFAESYISRTHDDVVLGVSGLVLAFTLVSLVNNIERRFNAMWGVETSRSLFGFSLSYLGLIVFLAFAIFFLSGVWVFILQLLHYLPHHAVLETTMPLFVFALKSLVFSGVLGAMFRFIPLVKVELRSFLWPSLIAGTVFSLVQEFYIEGQLFLSSYNAVYGSFAVLPLLMVWVYATWIIVLLGVILCWASQAVAYNNDEWEGKSHSEWARHMVALRLMVGMAHRFVGEERPLSVKEWADALELPTDFVGHELLRLAQVGLIFRVVEPDEHAHVPLSPTAIFKVDTDVHQLTAETIVQRLSSHGESASAGLSAQDMERYRAIVAQFGRPAAEQTPLLSL